MKILVSLSAPKHLTTGEQITKFNKQLSSLIKKVKGPTPELRNIIYLTEKVCNSLGKRLHTILPEQFSELTEAIKNFHTGESFPRIKTIRQEVSAAAFNKAKEILQDLTITVSNEYKFRSAYDLINAAIRINDPIDPVDLSVAKGITHVLDLNNIDYSAVDSY
jgi:hypothetical protein